MRNELKKFERAAENDTFRMCKKRRPKILKEHVKIEPKSLDSCPVADALMSSITLIHSDCWTPKRSSILQILFDKQSLF